MSENTPAVVAELGERALVARITSRLAMPSWVTVGPGDDAAVMEPVRGRLSVVTTDALVDGVHFTRKLCPPEAIGHRALAVNLSDLAAMGAAPRAAVLSLVLPDSWPVADLDHMLDGLLHLARQYPVALVGGNIARTPGPLVIGMTVSGTVHRRGILRRSGAKPGDEVYVSGTVGAAAVGRARLTSVGAQPTGDAEVRYLRPEPRVRLGLQLGRTHAASACIDLSDGLAAGAQQLGAASGVGITLDPTAVPLLDAVRQWYEERGENVVIAAGRDSDDYELLFTARPTHRRRLQAVCRDIGRVSVTRIGVITRTRELRFGDGPWPWPDTGFEHFR